MGRQIRSSKSQCTQKSKRCFSKRLTKYKRKSSFRNTAFRHESNSKDWCNFMDSRIRKTYSRRMSRNCSLISSKTQWSRRFRTFREGRLQVLESVRARRVCWASCRRVHRTFSLISLVNCWLKIRSIQSSARSLKSWDGNFILASEKWHEIAQKLRTNITSPKTKWEP